MKRPDPEARLRHMLEAARKVEAFICGRTREDLDRDEMLVCAITHAIEILGEAGKHVAAPTRKQNREIPWRQVIRTRDRLVHGYFDIDREILWEIASKDVPALIPGLEALLSKPHRQ